MPKTRALAGLLLAAAAAVFALRFAGLGLASFTRDEPQFLAAAREQPRTGTWLQANPLFGNLGRRYGPVAFWFYGAVAAVLGDGPRTAIAAMGALLTASQAAFAWAATRALGGRAVFLAAFGAWVASSPYLFFWSRMAWDLTSLAGGFAAVALVARPGAITPGRAALTGAALGVAVGTHPMMAPLALAVAAALAWESLREPRRLAASLVSLAGGATLVLLPYLAYLLRARVVSRAPWRGYAPGGAAALALEAPMIATPWRIERYFDGSWDAFLAWSGTGPLALAAPALAAAVAVAAAVGLACALRGPSDAERRLARVGLLAWPGSVLVIATLGLDAHVHYQFPAAWVPFFGVAALAAAAGRANPRRGAVALAVLGTVALAQAAFLVQWMRFVRAEDGTRGPTYGTVVAAQVEAVRAACALPGPRLALRNETAQFRYPFEYHARTLAECAGKDVIVCAEQPGPFARACPAEDAGTRLVRIRYANDTGGALRVD